MSSPSAGKRRSDSDVIKLIEANYEVTLLSGLNEFTVKFFGPKDTIYEGGIWKIRVDLPEKYPFKSPTICFMNKIYHPNIDEVSGSVCLDVINQKWSAMFDLKNIFETFLPQLLTYPNSRDPLNSEAGLLLEEDPDLFKRRVREYIDTYATEDALRRQQEEKQDDDGSSASSMSEQDDENNENNNNDTMNEAKKEDNDGQSIHHHQV